MDSQDIQLQAARDRIFRCRDWIVEEQLENTNMKEKTMMEAWENESGRASRIYKESR